MAKDFQPDDEREYNDGLGDLLREKERREFSWAKTAVVMTVLILVIFMGLVLVFSVGKTVLNKLSGKDQTIPEKVFQDIEKVEKEMTPSEGDIQNETSHVAATPNIENPSEESAPVSSPKPASKPEPKSEPKPEHKPESKPVKEHSVTKVTPKPVKLVHVEPVHSEPVVPAAPKKPHKTWVPPVSKKAVETASKVAIKGTPYKLIAGSFTTRQGAMNLQSKLKSQSIETYYWKSEGEGPQFHIQVGAFATPKEAEKYAAILRKKGFSPVVLKK